MNESEKSIHYILNHLESIDRHIKILAGDKKIDVEKLKTLDAIEFIQNYIDSYSLDIDRSYRKSIINELDELYKTIVELE